jgi:hypothetical protein
VYKLINSHGRQSEFIYFAEIIQDWGRLLDHWLSQKNWKMAIDVLSRQSNVDLYYKSAATLIDYCPTETVNLWMKQSNINPKNLIPALLRYNLSKGSNLHEQNESLRYLQYVTISQKNTDPFIHNFLLGLYVQHARIDSEKSLLTFLNSQVIYDV